ncbi:DNA-processing protein DprA [Corynebacterium uropygiale]|uniref:DNA-processing protein DprA n=1 Tax=Corynebacterium uropygiale TaxID=1775911 RepID=A0A9X1U748_9CORY|nr:DNA-processing protein DprA [Corynebacterium uropygiale]MCF4006382.1 DNA-processing protein DprA [Corynebacterium uropygiale]
MTHDEHQLAGAYLSRVIEGPSRPLQEHLAQGRSLEELAQAVKNREEWLGPELLRQTASRWDWDRAGEDLDEAERHGFRLLSAQSKEWPEEQFTVAFGYAATGLSSRPRTYREDAVRPHALWVKGQSLRTLTQQALAVVGTRALSAYGAEATRMIVRDMIQHQWTIVSGGALGADAVAHRCAVEAGAATIAVAACGPGVNYPAAHAELFRSIAERGALVSEYPPLLRPARHRFLTRNRLVAALSQGTVVVEAAWRSGALSTLTWAQAFGRVAMAVPGPVTSVASLGCHDKIRRGDAQLVTSGADIRSLLSTLGGLDVDQQYELQFAPDEVQRLSPAELKVFDALSEHKGTETEALASEAGLPLALTVHALMTLQQRGLCRREGITWRRIRHSGAAA